MAEALSAYSNFGPGLVGFSKISLTELVSTGPKIDKLCNYNLVRYGIQQTRWRIYYKVNFDNKIPQKFQQNIEFVRKKGIFLAYLFFYRSRRGEDGRAGTP